MDRNRTGAELNAMTRPLILSAESVRGGTLVVGDGHFELADCTGTLLREVAMPEMKRLDVAKTYSLALRSSAPTDWAKVNAAIIARWSLYALNWIKERAWSGRCWS